MPKLTLVRGLPGSGKSTFAYSMQEKDQSLVHYEADMFFFRRPGSYEYDIKLIGAAHDWCYANTVSSLWRGHDVVVSNTFTKMWELERYLNIPVLVDGVDLEIVEMRTQYDNIHGVPEDKLKTMAARWEEIPEAADYFVRVIDKGAS